MIKQRDSRENNQKESNRDKHRGRGEGRQKIRAAYVVIEGFCFSADKATLQAR